MKKILVFIICLLCINTYAQESLEPLFDKAKEMGFVFDDDSKFSFVKIIEPKVFKTKDELFNIIESYFSYNYGKGDFVIQVKNKEESYIIGKGIYPNLFEFKSSVVLVSSHSSFDAEHIVRIDCKDNKIRVIITIPKYRLTHTKIIDGREEVEIRDRYLSKNYYPFAPQEKKKLSRYEKERLGLFEASVNIIEKHFLQIENTLNKGNSILENEDW